MMSYKQIPLEESSVTLNVDHDSKLSRNDHELDDATELNELNPSEEVELVEKEIEIEEQAPSKPKHMPGLGLIYMAIATIFFSIMSMLVKLVGNQFPSFQLVFCRSFVQGIIVLIILLALKINPLGPPQYRKFLIIRGVTGFLSLSCFYYSIIALPLSEAVVLSFTSPVTTALWAMVILKEKWERIDIFGAVLSFGGVLMIARPSFLFGSEEESTAESDATRAIAVGISVLGAVFAGAAYVTVRKLGESVNALVFVFYFSCVCCVLSPIAMLFQEFHVPTSTSWLPLIGIGVVATAGQSLLNRGFQLEKAAKASAVNYLQIVWSFVWEITLLNEPLNLWSIFGALLITGWTIVIGYKSWRSSRRKV